MTSDSIRGEMKKCPKNFVIVGFCSADAEKDCDGKTFTITCAPIKFQECVNPEDVLNTEIELEYRTVLIKKLKVSKISPSCEKKFATSQNWPFEANSFD